MSETRSTCPYCGVGCGVVIEHDGGRITGIAGDPRHPANFGRLCSKGATLHQTTTQTTRALHPELRLARGTPRARLAWDDALDHAAQRFAGIIREHGPDAVAFYVSGQLLTEDYYVFNKLARALVGTNNIDSNSRLCMSSAVSAYKRTLGADAPPACYEDFDHAGCIMIAGSNTAYAHPVAFRRVLDARAARPGLKLVVIDPRVTDTAAAADLHLQIEPGTDTVLLGAMLHVLIWDGLIDGRFVAAHTAGFEAARDAVRELTPAVAARICGVRAEDIATAARWFGQADAAMSLWCQGLNQSQHGSDNGAALIHLHLATGQIGKPGAGPFSLTGQPNAMGGREVGAMANLLGGHRDPANAAHREEMARLWGIPALPAAPGKTAVEMFEAVRQGQIKAIWIACTNPAQSLPDQARVREALARAEFVVLQEAYADTETAAYADLLLPAATWGEKEGTVTNSERRISRVRAAVAPPGEARADWRIARDFALRLGLQLGVQSGCPETPRLFAFADAAEVFREHATTTVGRDLDIGGLSHEFLEAAGPQQWPLPAGSASGQKRLYENRVFASDDGSGRARFVPVSLAASAEATDARLPLHLNTGRLRDQWHGMSRTGKLAQLMNHADTPTAALHPADLERRGLHAGELATLTSKRGSIVLPLAADATLKPGHVFVAMHWGSRRLSHAGVNQLTAPVVDPYSHQPELKHAAIAVARAELPWRGVLLRQATGPHATEQVLAWDTALAPFIHRFGYASLTLAGRGSPLLRLQLAAESAPDPHLLEDLLTATGLGAAPLHYDDATRNIHKCALVEHDRIAAIALFGETAAEVWLREAMLGGQPAAPLRRWLFAPLATVPLALPARGRVVCSCHDVAEQQIEAAIAAGANTLDQLQDGLQCGTGCGACVPEIRRMLMSPKLPMSPNEEAVGSPLC